MIKLIHSLLALTLLILTASCSGNSDTSANNEPYISPADSSAFLLGRDNARAMLIECHTTNEIRDRLLELRARQTSIESRISASASQAYIHGIRSYLTESGDTLAQTLF